MATKRKKKRSIKARTSKTRAPKRIKRRRKKLYAGVFADFFTPGSAKESALNLASGAAGGAIAGLVDRFTPNQTPTRKALIIGAGAFITGGVLKKPLISAGMAGVSAYMLLMNSNLMAPLADNFAEPIEELPPFLSDEYSLSDPYLLAQDGEAIEAIIDESYMPDYSPQYDQMLMNY